MPIIVEELISQWEPSVQRLSFHHVLVVDLVKDPERWGGAWLC